MKELKIGSMVRVKEENTIWTERKLLAILPESLSSRYVCQNHSESTYSSTWKYCEPIAETETRWRAMRDNNPYTICTEYFYNQAYIDEEFHAEDGWYKGESITVTL